MTADLVYGCYSTVSDYKVTTGCLRVLPQSDVGTSTKTYTVNGTASKDLIETITATHPLSVTTTTFAASQTDMLVGVSVLPMIQLVRHQSDLKATGTAGAGSTKATTTSNSAATVAPKANTWNGLGGILGVSLAAIAFGAAVVFQ